MLFVDVECPRCGQACGNGGAGMVFCRSCGWMGRLDPKDERVLAEIFRKHQERNDEA